MTIALTFCVDAGATRSRGRLFDAVGNTLAEAEGGPANAGYDREQALASLRDLWNRLAAVVGRNGEHVSDVAFAIGGAGLYVPAARDAFLARCPAFASIVAMSDGYAALIGAGGGEPAALLTVGTGVAGHRLFPDGSSIQRDAWGWIAGDRGGGAWMGTRALRHALEAADGIVPPSPLARAVMEKLGGVDGLLGGALSNLNAHRLAAFAPLVLAEAGKGCAVSAEILSRAVTHLAALVGALECEAVPLFLNGGLAEIVKPMLAAHIGRPAAEAAGDALAGCLLVAQGKAPPERMVFAHPAAKGAPT